MCRVYLHQASMGKSSKKIGKIHNYPSFWKVTKLVARALVAIRRKKKLVKPQHWHFCIILKRSNNIKAVKTGVTLKVLCYWQSQISELLRSVLEILSFWNKFWIKLAFVIAKKSQKTKRKAIKHTKTFSNLAELHFDNYTISYKELDLCIN